jgi:hypothetical protein
MGDLPESTKVQGLRKALYEKAKNEPKFVFYSLYDEIYRVDILLEAYRQVKQNDGSPGVDRQTFEDIDELGRTQWLGSLANELRKRPTSPGPLGGYIYQTRTVN